MKKALLEFLQTDNELYAFLVTPKAFQVFTLPVRKIEIISVVQGIRNFHLNRGSQISGILMKEVQAFSMDAFMELGRRIFSPELQNALADIGGLYIVPYQDLHYLPLHAMPFGTGYLIDHMEVAYLPAASLLPYLSRRPEHRPEMQRFLGVGVDAYDLNGAFNREVSHIRDVQIWTDGSIKLLRGKEANKVAVLSHLAQFQIIHFSTHGYFSARDPLESGLLLYTDEEQFQVQERERTDLILSAYDLRRLKLTAELVTMSGCVTGQSEHHPGDELLGLSRSLLFSGAKGMILSLFASFKAVTAHPETHFGVFYRYWIGDGMTRSAAFRAYILRIKSEPAFAHPLFWFPYIYIGSID